MPKANQVWTVDEAADYLRVSAQTVYRRLQVGKMPGAKVGKSWRLRKVDIDDYLRGTWKPAAKASKQDQM